MDVVCKPEYKSAVQRIRDLYNEAEVDLKSYGREDNRLFVPGVNQLGTRASTSFVRLARRTSRLQEAISMLPSDTRNAHSMTSTMRRYNIIWLASHESELSIS